jgi:hypothetical protein
MGRMARARRALPACKANSRCGGRLRVIATEQDHLARQGILTPRPRSGALGRCERSPYSEPPEPGKLSALAVVDLCELGRALVS